ncbi:hypothetical protein Gotur_022468 [Gossypium turneri]
MSWKPKETMWHLPWKYQVPQRVPFFLWLAFKQQLLTNTERVHRGLRHNSVCGHISEDVIHAIRDCPAARSIWHQEHDSDIIKGSYSWAKQYISVSRRHVTEVCGATPCSILSESGVCLNTEGSVRHDDGFAVVGGFVRDHYKKWLFEFNRYLGSCSVFDAELWGILDGLTCLVDRCYDNIIIQSNNLDVVKNIQEGLVEGSNSALVRIIHQILLRLGHWSICHIHREDNQDADRLIKMIHERSYELRMFETSPFGEGP